MFLFHRFAIGSGLDQHSTAQHVDEHYTHFLMLGFWLGFAGVLRDCAQVPL